MKAKLQTGFTAYTYSPNDYRFYLKSIFPALDIREIISIARNTDGGYICIYATNSKNFQVVHLCQLSMRAFISYCKPKQQVGIMSKYHPFRTTSKQKLNNILKQNNINLKLI